MITVPPEITKEVEPSPAREEALAQPSESPDEVNPTSIQEEVPAQPAQHPEEFYHSSVQQEASAQAPEFLIVPKNNEMAPGLAGLFQAYESKLRNVTLKPMDVELVIAPGY